MTQIAFRAANQLFRHCYPVYFALYSRGKPSQTGANGVFSGKPSGLEQLSSMSAPISASIPAFFRAGGDTGRVHAFEPAETNFTHLRKTAGGRANVSLNHAAVGDHSGTTTLYLSDEMNVDHRTFDSADGRAGVQVPLVALNDYFAPGARVDVIKIDVQGFEMSVLRGASRLFAENPQLEVLMEFWPYGLKKAGTDPQGIIAWIEAQGFCITALREVAHPGRNCYLEAPESTTTATSS